MKEKEEKEVTGGERQQKESKLEMNKTPEKSKEEILAERQSKKAVKMVKKTGNESGEVKKEVATSPANVKIVQASPAGSKVAQASPASAKLSQQSAAKPQEIEKSKEQIHAEREAKKLAKQAAKKKIDVGTTPTVTPVKPVAATPSQPKPPVAKTNSDADLAGKLEKLHIDDSETPGKKILSKAERRAIQEAQRAAKVKALEEKKTPAKKVSETPSKKVQETPGKKIFETPMKIAATKPTAVHKVKLFKHLYSDKCDYNINVNQKLHPAIVKLGLQYASDSVVGSNSRCYAFLNAMKIVSRNFVDFDESF